MIPISTWKLVAVVDYVGSEVPVERLRKVVEKRDLKETIFSETLERPKTSEWPLPDPALTEPHAIHRPDSDMKPTKKSKQAKMQLKAVNKDQLVEKAFERTEAFDAAEAALLSPRVPTPIHLKQNPPWGVGCRQSIIECVASMRVVSESVCGSGGGALWLQRVPFRPCSSVPWCLGGTWWFVDHRSLCLSGCGPVIDNPLQPFLSRSEYRHPSGVAGMCMCLMYFLDRFTNPQSGQTRRSASFLDGSERCVWAQKHCGHDFVRVTNMLPSQITDRR